MRVTLLSACQVSAHVRAEMIFQYPDCSINFRLHVSVLSIQRAACQTSPHLCACHLSLRANPAWLAQPPPHAFPNKRPDPALPQDPCRLISPKAYAHHPMPPQTDFQIPIENVLNLDGSKPLHPLQLLTADADSSADPTVGASIQTQDQPAARTPELHPT